jgi:hypothetical protein
MTARYCLLNSSDSVFPMREDTMRVSSDATATLEKTRAAVSSAIARGWLANPTRSSRHCRLKYVHETARVLGSARIVGNALRTAPGDAPEAEARGDDGEAEVEAAEAAAAADSEAIGCKSARIGSQFDGYVTKVLHI